VGKYRLKQQHPRFSFLVKIEANGYQPAMSRNINSDDGNETLDFELKRVAKFCARLIQQA